MVARPRNHLYLLKQALMYPANRPDAAAIAQRQDRCQIAPDLDPQSPVLRHQHDRLDHGPDRRIRPVTAAFS